MENYTEAFETVRRRRAPLPHGIVHAGAAPRRQQQRIRAAFEENIAERDWQSFQDQWARKYKPLEQYGIKGLSYKEWLKKTKEVSETRGRTVETTRTSPYYRWKKNPAFARLDERREEIKQSYTTEIDRAKREYKNHHKLYQKFSRTYRFRGFTQEERRYLEGNLWRYETHRGIFSKLGPAGFFSENTVIKITLSRDIATFAQIIYPSIMTDNEAIIRLQDDLLSKVILPTVRHGVLLIMKYVPMMTGKLRETMLTALRNYKRFQFPNIYEAEVFIHTIGLMYSKPVNNMPEESLKHPHPDGRSFRRVRTRLYYLRDEDARTEWFQKVLEELREYAKQRWLDFESFLLRALTTFRLLKQDETQFTADLRGHDPGVQMVHQLPQIQAIVSEIFPRLRAITSIMNKYELLKSMTQSVLPQKRNPAEGYNRSQRSYIRSLMEESIYGEPRSLNTKSFIKLFISVKFTGGTTR